MSGSEPKQKTPAPDRIWLLLHEGDRGEHVWCDQPDPTGTGCHDAVEYIRADLVKGNAP